MINPNLSNLNNAALQYLTSLSKEEIKESGLINREQFLIPQVQPTIPQVQPTIPEVQPQQYQAAQEGGPIQNAETDLEAMLGPMGVINDNDGSPGPSLGGEGVADDLTMEVPEGSYILNSDAVSLIGISDINTVIRDAYTIAAALGQELPADYDPQNKVPIRISNGEAVIPAPLVGVIGLDRLERWNAKGLEVRRQREEAEKAQAETQAAQPVTEAPPVQPMQAQMGEMMGFKDGDKVETELLAAPEDDRDLATRIASFFGVEDVPQDILSWFEDNTKDILPESILEKVEYGDNVAYNRKDIDDAINKVSRVLTKGNDEYQELTKVFLTEIANAESTYGQDKTTNKSTRKIVGPFQVGYGKNHAYTEIKKRLKDDKYKETLWKNLDAFKATDWGKDIEWNNLKREDLMNPLINATIARLYLSTIDEKEIPKTKRGRAELWDRVYNSKSDPSNADYYITKNMWITKQRPEID